jgi:CBS domain-containing protein
LINPVWPIDTLQLAQDKVERFRHVPVMDEEKLAGILTDRDKRQ